MNLSAVPLRQQQLGIDTFFRAQKTGLVLVVADFIILHSKLRKSLSYLRRIKDVVADVIFARRSERILEKIRDMARRSRSFTRDDQPTGHLQQGFPGFPLELPPYFVGTKRQRGVLLALANRLACDASIAVG